MVYPLSDAVDTYFSPAFLFFLLGFIMSIEERKVLSQKADSTHKIYRFISFLT